MEIKENYELQNKTGATFRTLVKHNCTEGTMKKLNPVFKTTKSYQMFAEFIEKYYPDFYDGWYEPSEYQSLAIQFGSFMAVEFGYSRYGKIIKDNLNEYINNKIGDSNVKS